MYLDHCQSRSFPLFYLGSPKFWSAFDNCKDPQIYTVLESLVARGLTKTFLNNSSKCLRMVGVGVSLTASRNARKWPCVANSPYLEILTKCLLVMVVFLRNSKDEDNCPALSTGLAGLWLAVWGRWLNWSETHREWRKKLTAVCLPTSGVEEFTEHPGYIAPSEGRMTWSVCHRSPFGCMYKIKISMSLGCVLDWVMNLNGKH